MTAESHLSERKRQVTVLLSRGLTNREIADALVVSERTAATHLEHVRAKLRATSPVR